MKLEDVLKPQFVSGEKNEVKESFSAGEKEKIVSEMVSIIQENMKLEEELSQENVLNC